MAIVLLVASRPGILQQEHGRAKTKNPGCSSRMRPPNGQVVVIKRSKDQSLLNSLGRRGKLGEGGKRTRSHRELFIRVNE